MATTTASRTTRIPVQEHTLVKEPHRMPPDPVQAKIAEMRVEEMAKFEIEAEARVLRQRRKEIQQEARNKEAAKVDAIAREKQVDEWLTMIRGASQPEFKKILKRLDYIPAEMDDMIRERQGFPTISKAIGKSKADDLVAELKRRGVLPQDFQAASTMSGTPPAEDASIDLNDPAENAASGD